MTPNQFLPSEHRFDPLTEPKVSIYQPDQAGLLFPGIVYPRTSIRR